MKITDKVDEVGSTKTVSQVEFWVGCQRGKLSTKKGKREWRTSG